VPESDTLVAAVDVLVIVGRGDAVTTGLAVTEVSGGVGVWWLRS
jgi:hypothetical protein